jgi:hypothetical protein
MSTPIGVAIVGLGFGVRVQLPGFRALGDDVARVVALCGRDGDEAGRIAAAEGIPFATADWREALVAPGVDLVSIATPPGTHAEIAAAALASGRAVLCEKPLALGWPEVVSVVEASQNSGAPTLVDFIFRAVPAFRVARGLIEEGRLGTLESVEVEWTRTRSWSDRGPASWKDLAAAGGGVLANYGIHVLDYVSWLAGPSTRVAAVLERPGGHPERADERAAVGLTLGSGARATIELCVRPDSPTVHRVRLRGDRGELLLENADPVDHVGAFVVTLDRTRLTTPAPRFGHGAADTRVGPFAEHAASLVTALSTGRAAVPSFHEALEAHALHDAVLNASASGSEAEVRLLTGG